MLLGLFSAIITFCVAQPQAPINPFGECGDDLIPYLAASSDLNYKATPNNYYLSLELHPETDLFNGKVDIFLDINFTQDHFSHYPAMANVIYLHVDPKLAVTSTLLLQNNNLVAINQACRYRSNRFWAIETLNKLTDGGYRLQMTFNGRMEGNGSTRGLFKEVYSVDNNNWGTVVTMMSAAGVFPCFEDRRFKTAFRLEIEHPREFTALSSYEQIGREVTVQHPMWSRTTFESQNPRIFLTLPAMSFNLNQFEVVGGADDLVRVWLRPEFQDAADYAIHLAPRILEIYANYTNLPCPFRQLNFVVHIDYPARGIFYGRLVQFKEETLLWRAGESTIDSQMTLLTTLAHELAHIWFGGRTIAVSESHGWLEEAFAEWMRFKSLPLLEPDLDFADEQILCTKYGFEADSVESPAVNALFPEHYVSVEQDHRIVYNKGFSVLRMMEEHIGAARFQVGIRAFLQDSTGGWIHSEMLLQYLQQQVPQEEINIDAVYRTWILQKGFPVVRVQQRQDGIWISQERFLMDVQAPGNTIWSIPIRYYVNGAPATPILLNTRNMRVDGIRRRQLYKFNIEHQGFYITWYRDWNHVRDYVATHPLTSRDTAGLLLDLLFLTTSYKLRFPEVADLVGEVFNRSDAVVTWNVGSMLTNAFYHHVKTDEGVLESFSQTVRGWLAGKYRSDMWVEGNQTQQRQTRFAVLVIDMACRFGHRQCLRDAWNQFYLLRRANPDADLGQLPLGAAVHLPMPNMRQLVLCYGLKTSEDPQDLQFLLNVWAVALDRPLMKLKSEIESAMSCVRHEDLRQLYFKFVKDEFEGRHQEKNLVEHLKSIAANPAIVNHGWDFFEANFLRDPQISEENRAKVVLAFARACSDRGQIPTFDEQIFLHLNNQREHFLPQINRVIRLNHYFLVRHGFRLEAAQQPASNP